MHFLVPHPKLLLKSIENGHTLAVKQAGLVQNNIIISTNPNHPPEWVSGISGDGKHIISHGLKIKGVTLHSRLYFHPWLRSRSRPIKISCLTPWPHQKSSLDPWLSSINHAHRSPGEPLTVSKLPPIPTLTAWPASNSALTAWPDFDPGHGWEYSRLCSVPPLKMKPLVIKMLLK